ncbi:MAG: hypothetical protein GX770_03685 [Firmicutes bacterium]|nr:hypothetical protein [Bacillota bacterium]
MKRVISLLLVVVLLVTTTSSVFAFSDSYFEGQLAGKKSAETNHNAGGWFVGGAAGGFLLGIIGGGITVGLSAASKPQPDSEILYTIKDQPLDYRMGFTEGYVEVARSKNIQNSCIGAGLGVILAVVVVSSMNY